MSIGIIDLSGNNWFDQLIEMIEKQQNSPIWMSETKVSKIKPKAKICCFSENLTAV